MGVLSVRGCRAVATAVRYIGSNAVRRVSASALDDDAEVVGDDGEPRIRSLEVEGQLNGLVDGGCGRHVHGADRIRGRTGRSRTITGWCARMRAKICAVHWSGSVWSSGAVDAGLLELGRVASGDAVEEPLAAVPVRASGDSDDDAAVAQRRLGGGHALHDLVDVLVERVAAVRCDRDVAIYGSNTGEFAHEGAPRLVRRVDVARRHR